MQRILLKLFLAFTWMAAVLAPTTVAAGPLQFTLNTSALNGTSAILAFDFIGEHNNTATISDLLSSGASLSGANLGDVSGTLPSAVTLATGASFFNEASLQLVLGDQITFRIHLSDNGPPADGLPDTLALFLLDPASGLPLFDTADPAGTGALFVWEIDGSSSGALGLFSTAEVVLAAEPFDPVALPEPSSLWLVVPVLMVAALRRYRGSARTALLALAAVGLTGAGAVGHAAPLDGKISISKGGLVLNRTTNTYDSVVTLTNTSATPVAAPLLLTIKDITGPGVAVYNTAGFDDQDNAQVAVALNLGVLQPGAKATVPVKFVNPGRSAFSYQVEASGTLLDAESSGALTVTVYRYSGNEASPAGVAAGAGVELLIDGVLVGVTNSAGQATLVVPLDTTSISAQRPPTEVGSAEVEMLPGQANAADIVLSDDGEVYANGVLRIDQVQNLLLPSGFLAFSARFVLPGEATAKIVDLALVELFDSIGNSQGVITGMFQLNTDGSIRPVNIAAFRSLLASKSGGADIEGHRG